ncbi:hypothetical protein D3C76_1273340 [compost metagenome]
MKMKRRSCARNCLKNYLRKSMAKKMKVVHSANWSTGSVENEMMMRCIDWCNDCMISPAVIPGRIIGSQRWHLLFRWKVWRHLDIQHGFRVFCVMRLLL